VQLVHNCPWSEPHTLSQYIVRCFFCRWARSRSWACPCSWCRFLRLLTGRNIRFSETYSLQAGQEPQLGMRVQLVHGDEVISDSAEAGGLAEACRQFKSWVQKTYNLKK